MQTQTHTQTHLHAKTHTMLAFASLKSLQTQGTWHPFHLSIFITQHNENSPPPPPHLPRERERICSLEGNVESPTLIMWALTVTLALKIRFPLLFSLSLFYISKIKIKITWVLAYNTSPCHVWLQKVRQLTRYFLDKYQLKFWTFAMTLTFNIAIR